LLKLDQEPVSKWTFQSAIEDPQLENDPETNAAEASSEPLTADRDRQVGGLTRLKKTLGKMKKSLNFWKTQKNPVSVEPSVPTKSSRQSSAVVYI
jgi:hypothetical protein